MEPHRTKLNDRRIWWRRQWIRDIAGNTQRNAGNMVLNAGNTVLNAGNTVRNAGNMVLNVGNMVPHASNLEKTTSTDLRGCAGLVGGVC